MIPGLGRSTGEGIGYPLQYSDLENSMYCSLPRSSVHGILQARILSELPFNSHRQLWSLKFRCFPHSSVGKESACNAGDPCSIPGLGRSLGEGKGYPCQYFSLENSMDCIVHGVTKSWTPLSDFHFYFTNLD